MQRNNKQKQEVKLKKDDQQRQKRIPASEEISATGISAESISKKQQTALVTENISAVVETDVSASSELCSSKLKVKISQYY